MRIIILNGLVVQQLTRCIANAKTRMQISSRSRQHSLTESKELLILQMPVKVRLLAERLCSEIRAYYVCLDMLKEDKSAVNRLATGQYSLKAYKKQNVLSISKMVDKNDLVVQQLTHCTSNTKTRMQISSRSRSYGETGYHKNLLNLNSQFEFEQELYKTTLFY